MKVRDLWAHADVATLKRPFTFTVRALYRSAALLCNGGKKVDFVYLVATMPGRHSGDQVHKVKKTAAPRVYILLLQAAVNGSGFAAAYTLTPLSL